MIVSVKLGFVPSYRFDWTAWAAKMREESLAAFAKIPGLEIVVPQPSADNSFDAEKGLSAYGSVGNSLDQAEAVAEYFASQKVDGVILCPLDFGDERTATKVAEKLGVPVLLYATKEPPASLDDPSLGRLSDSYCGNLSIASGLYRRKIPFHFAGIFFPDEPALVQEVDTFTRAVAVVKGLKGARLGQVGVRPAAFETVGYDETALIRKFGQNVIYAELAAIAAEANKLADDDPEVLAVIDRIKRTVPNITVSESHLLKSSKLEVVLARFWQRNRLSAMAVQCWPTFNQLIGLSVCSIYGRLTDRHMLTACETDILGALAMLVNYQAAMGETVPHFIDWTIQHRENPNWLLAWHCGNAPVSLACQPKAVALRSRRDMKGELPVQEEDPMAGLNQFQIKPGVVTFCRLQEYDDAWKMLIAKGEIIPSNETLAGTWSWVEVKDHDKLYRTLIEEGFVHHASMIHGDQTTTLLQACKYLAIKPILVE